MKLCAENGIHLLPKVLFPFIHGYLVDVASIVLAFYPAAMHPNKMLQRAR